MRRGLTMIEMLLALALLGAVSIVALSWLQLAAGTGAQLAPQREWRATTDAFVQLLDDALACADFDERQTRTEVRAGSLLLRTRLALPGADAGPQELQFIHRPVDQTLMCRIKNEERPLLGGVRRWHCSVDEKREVLRIELEADRGWTVEREFEL